MSESSSTKIGDLPPQNDAGPILLGVSSILMVFALISTFSRIYVRISNKIMGWDDATIIVAVLLSIARLGFQIEQAKYGDGKHWVHDSASNYTMINKYGWNAQLLLFSAVAFLKVSICLLILRIKDTRALRIVVFTIMAGALFTNFGCVIILLAECHPIGFWRGASATCWPRKIRIYSIYGTIAYSVVTDLILSFIPLFIVWKTNIPFRSKIYVYCLTGLGLIATGFGTARAALLDNQRTDLSFPYSRTAIWSNLELFLGINAANLALSRAIYRGFAHPSQQTPSPNPALPSPSYAIMLHGDCTSQTNTVIECGNKNRRPAVNSSESIEMEMVPGIQKRMEFWVSEEDLEAGD